MKKNKYNHKLPSIDKLKSLYFDDSFSGHEIASMYGVTHGAVVNKLKRHGIKPRTLSEAFKGNRNAKGFKFSEEHCRKKSELMKRLGSKPPSRKGCKLTTAHRRKIGDAQRGAKGSNWHGGISNQPYPQSWDKCLKESIKIRDGFVCQICTEHGDVVHHIDYNKSNCDPLNLITLCKPCHSKTNFNRGNWKKILQNIIKERMNVTEQSKSRQ